MLDPEVLKKFVEDSGLSFRKNSISWIFDCPRCNKKNKLFLRKRDGRFVCWVCKEIDNFQGKPEYALAELLVQPLYTIKAALYGEVAPESPGSFTAGLTNFFGDEDDFGEEISEFPSIQWPWDYYPLADVHSTRGRAYLEKRGLTLETADEYGLKYCPSRRRLAFPVYLRGDLIGYQERTVLDSTKTWNEEDAKYYETPKMLSSLGIPRDRLVMFADRLIGSDHAILCEGPIDALKAHLCGGNVAAMGKAVAKGQIEFLRSQGITKLYLALDPDAAEETARIVKQFAGLETFLMHPPAGYKDLGEMTMEAVKELFLVAPKVDSSRIFVFLDGNSAVL